MSGPRSEVVSIRFTPEEVAELKAAAAESGRSLSVYLHDRLLADSSAERALFAERALDGLARNAGNVRLIRSSSGGLVTWIGSTA